MRTVKEVSQLTGISIRTLRYYDDKALEKLRGSMFFKEMDIPLEAIKKILENPEKSQKLRPHWIK